MTPHLRAALACATLAACRPAAPARRDAGVRCHCHDAAPPPAARPLPDTSVYTLDIPLTDQGERAARLTDFAGRPTVLLMFYGTCRSACPVLVRDVQRVEAALSPTARARVRFALVTFDPETDTPSRLRELAAERGLDLTRWTLLRPANDGDVRTLATVLGVQYSRVGPGEFTHSNVITLLDAQGLAAAQLEGLQQPVEAFAQRVEAAARP